MFTDKLVQQFDSTTRARGAAYSAQDRVTHLSVDSDRIRARVKGTRTYAVDVAIERSPKHWLLTSTCTCPIGDGGDTCKHLWAVLLDAQKSDVFRSQLAPSKVKLKVAYPDDDEYADEMDDGYDEYDDEEDGDDRPARRSKDRPPIVVLSDRVANLALADGSIAQLQRQIEAATGAPVRFFSTMRPGASGKPAPPKKPEKKPEWQRLIETVQPRHATPEAFRRPTFVTPLYALDLARSRQCSTIVLRTFKRPSDPKTKPKRLRISSTHPSRFEDARDTQIIAMLTGQQEDHGYGDWSAYRSYSYAYSSSNDTSEWQVHTIAFEQMLPLLLATERFFSCRDEQAPLEPLALDPGEPWELMLSVRPSDPPSSYPSSKDRPEYTLSSAMCRPGEHAPIAEFDLLTDGDPGFCVRRGLLGRSRLRDCDNWIKACRDWKPVPIRRDDLPNFVRQISSKVFFPRLDLPPDSGLTDTTGAAPTPRLILRERVAPRPNDPFPADIEFQYADQIVPHREHRPVLISSDARAVLRRDHDAEARLVERALDLGVKADAYNSRFHIPEKKFARVIGNLIAEGWTVLGGKDLYRPAGEIHINVSSGIDWFELNGTVEFGEHSASLPELLAAVHKGEQFILLCYGSLGMLPDEWLEKNRAWLQLGRADKDGVRFSKAQLSLIDALLAQLPKASCDEQLLAARAKLRAFDGIAPRQEPPAFTGRLRDYQRDGLGWLHFLADFNFGGCLADDMGLGKTVQLLAHVCDTRERGDRGPWLVVAPKSVVFNWQREAARFAPHLRAISYTGVERAQHRDALAANDLILTTYGTLRKDAPHLREIDFAGVVLDEAQAIKNPDSLNAKAARLLRARRRLAMTGTPVENHLGDLWSIFEFLNPGMLGTLPAFKGAFTAASRKDSALPVLARAVRPFILRRTKEKVAPELPPRTEETITCELPPKQRTLYNELRDHYRRTLLAKVDKAGLAKSKIIVLEALLRLRQAACHPGLIDPAKASMESAKLETLTAMLTEMIDGGHKGLVFSQFTSMLAIVKDALDKAGFKYEYLDGGTSEKARAAAVDRFQADPACPLFLISLKAGGFGLNLTAADYVFILDPWWNPAVEAQAIDRAHRIGQDKKVIAYRLIAADTVESRILELQKSKRELAEAIVGEQESLIRTLTRDDLAALLA